MLQRESRLIPVVFTPDLTDGLEISSPVEWYGEPELMIAPAASPEDRHQAGQRHDANVQRLTACKNIIELLGVKNKKNPHFEVPVGYTCDSDLSFRRISLVIDETVSRNASERRIDQNYVQFGPLTDDDHFMKQIKKKPHNPAIFGHYLWPSPLGIQAAGRVTERSGLRLSLAYGRSIRGKDETLKTKPLGSLVDPESAIVFGAGYNHHRRSGNLELVNLKDNRLLDMWGLLSLAELVVRTRDDDVATIGL